MDLSPFTLRCRTPVLPSPTYTVDLQCACDGSILAAATTDAVVAVYDISRLSSTPTPSQLLNTTEGGITGEISFHKINPMLLWNVEKAAEGRGRGGQVGLWDLRSGQLAIRLQTQKPASTFSVNCDESLVAVGTELAGEDADLTFWDARTPSAPAATFSECHSDDITQVRFHPTNPKRMISGGTDGLLCLYDMSTFDEDDALDKVIKDTSVNRCGFFGPSNEFVYLCTHIETFSLWRPDESEKLSSLGDVRVPRPDDENPVAREYEITYMVDCKYSDELQRLFVFCGSSTDNLSVMNVGLEELSLVYTLNGGHNAVVRTTYWDMKKRFIVTGGEDGAISVWA
ncbi:WD40-repeat-containing domain protein [Cladochytrium replicatum]|nr:WD40-repeat-containing domain protein [Cladochytrium replicatum]